MQTNNKTLTIKVLQGCIKLQGKLYSQLIAVGSVIGVQNWDTWLTVKTKREKYCILTKEKGMS